VGLGLTEFGLIGEPQFRCSGSGHFARSLALGGSGVSAYYVLIEKTRIVKRGRLVRVNGLRLKGPLEVWRCHLRDVSLTATPRDRRARCFRLPPKDPTQPNTPRTEQLEAVLA
jgi:hypothetical protein